jgi:hypothetical protein
MRIKAAFLYLQQTPIMTPCKRTLGPNKRALMLMALLMSIYQKYNNGGGFFAAKPTPTKDPLVFLGGSIT